MLVNEASSSGAGNAPMYVEERTPSDGHLELLQAVIEEKPTEDQEFLR